MSLAAILTGERTARVFRAGPGRYAYVNIQGDCVVERVFPDHWKTAAAAKRAAEGDGFRVVS